MIIKIFLASLLITHGLCAEQEKQVVAHAMTEIESRDVFINGMLNDLKRFAIHGSSLDEKEYVTYLLNTYGDIQEFRFLCSFFDLMHKECENTFSIKADQTELVDALIELRSYIFTYTSNTIPFIPVYMNARAMYNKYMNCPEFVELYNLFIKINENEKFKQDQQITDEKIRRFKRMAIGAIVAGFAEGAINI